MELNLVFWQLLSERPGGILQLHQGVCPGAADHTGVCAFVCLCCSGVKIITAKNILAASFFFLSGSRTE